MKYKTRKIIASILTLLLTIISVGTTTVAWFTLGSITKISNIHADVRADGGLSVRMGIEDKYTPWKSNLTNDDWNKLLSSAKINNIALDTLEIYNNQLIKFSQNEEGTFVRNPDVIKNKEYLEFFFEFSSPEEGYVHLDNLEFIDAKNKTEYKSSVTIRDLDGNYVRDITIDGNNALRVTLMSDGNDDVTYFNGHPHLNTRYNSELEDGTRGFGYVGQWTFIEGRGVVFEEEVEDINSLMNGVSFEKVGTLEYHNSYSVKLEKENIEDEEYVARIKVWLWIDGWDPHAFHAILSQTLGFNARFILADKANTETDQQRKHHIRIEDNESLIANYYDNQFDLSLLEEEPIKEGYEFLGWFIKDNLIIDLNETIDIDKNIIIYSRWRKEP